MEILAGLIRLEDASHLPVPWYNRPALGLISGTPVYVGVVTSRTRAKTSQALVPPDIIVTPLKYSRLHHTVSLTVDLSENQGAIHSVLDIVRDNFNIALMETVTIDQRMKHRVTMVLEPPTQKSTEPSEFNEHINSLVDALNGLEPLGSISQLRLANDTVDFESGQRSKVLGGRVEVSEVMEWIQENYGHLAKEFDFSRVVVSSNSESRFIRYLFPRQGSFEASITHEDIPTAMRQITHALNQLKYNILLSRISKSEAKNPENHQKSVTVAICEPALG